MVTGFGPFLRQFPRNSSWEIASTLPALLPATASSPTPIHIHVHHLPIRVAYDTVTDLIPGLLKPHNPMYPPADIILHIGLAAGRDFYTLERGAHSRGFGIIPDVDGKRFSDERAEKRFPRAQFPPTLHTSFDTGDVLERWQGNLGYSDSKASGTEAVGEEEKHKSPPPDVRLSPDAGNFMCGFIYYNSLAHYFEMKEDDRPVVFLHVPDLSDSKKQLDVGREVAIALIQALVESRRQKGVVDGTERLVKGQENARMVGEGEDAKAETDVNFAQ